METKKVRVRKFSSKECILNKWGEEGAATYGSWMCMKARCLNKKHKCYHNYGGRGITIDPRWMVFENFLSDMGYRKKGFTLDRKENNKGYYLENCKWSNSAEQGFNRRTNIMVEFQGMSMSLLGACRHFGLKNTRVREYMRLYGLSFIEILFLRNQRNVRKVSTVSLLREYFSNGTFKPSPNFNINTYSKRKKNGNTTKEGDSNQG